MRLDRGPPPVVADVAAAVRLITERALTKNPALTSIAAGVSPRLLKTVAKMTDHADAFANLAASTMADDVRLAVQAITPLTGPPRATDKVPPELISVTSVEALLNRLLDHGEASGDRAPHTDIETAARLVFTLWDVIERAGIKESAIETKPVAPPQGMNAVLLYVKVEEIDGDKVMVIHERIAFDEIIGDDDVERAEALYELRHGGVTRIGGGSSPLYRLTKVGR